MDVEHTPEASLEHHPRLYFPDGDVILSANETGGELNFKKTLLLRVHRFMLSHSSDVFKNMFSFPTNPNTNEMYDGVPVVRMPDPADDLAGLIGALYDTDSIQLGRFDPDVPLIIRGILLLATKYEIHSVRSRIVKHVESDWPRSVEEWYLRHCEFEKKKHFFDVGHAWNGEPPELQFPEPASAIRLAVDCNMPSILPATYYRLAISDVGRTWGSGEGPTRTQLSARWDLLERDEWKRWAVGKSELFRRCRFFEVYVPRAPQCEVKDECRNARHDAYEAASRRRNMGSALRPDLLWTIFECLEDDIESTEICWYCQNALKQRLRDLLERTWNDLPEIFGLLPPTAP